MRTTAANGVTGPQLDRKSALAAIAFGLLPDILSMGPAFVRHMLIADGGHFFVAYGGSDLVLYRLTHSLIVSLAFSGVILLVGRAFFLPSLAWPLHVVCDMFTHSASKFRTTVFYPLFSWGFNGLRWWEHPEVIAVYWVIVGFLWLARMGLARHSFSRD